MMVKSWLGKKMKKMLEYYAAREKVMSHNLPLNGGA